ncbi:MAG: YqaA family protein [Myxococcota bacterium]
MLHWAETPYGSPALFLLALAESSFFPVPPDPLLIALGIGERKKAFKFALVCSIASVLGGIIGYGIGYALWQPEVAEWFYSWVPGFSEGVFNRVKETYQNYDFWFVFAAGFTPIPYKVFTIAGGVCEISFPMFVFASALSRSARFFLVAGLIYKFGEPIRNFIDKYFDMLAILFTVLLIGGFIAIKYFSG